MSFKLFLEKYAVPSGSKEWDMMIKGFLPLHHTVLDQEIKVPKAFRVSSFTSLTWTKKGQGKKRQLPCFLKGSKALASGAPSGSDVLIELEGTTSIHLPIDSGTIISRNGYRWIMDTMFLRDFVPEWYDNITNEMEKWFKKNYPNEVNLIYSPDYYTLRGISDHIDTYWTGKEKQEFIKWYFDTAKKIIKKHNVVDVLVNSVYEWYKHSSFDNDEVLLQNYKIKGVWVIEIGIPKNFTDMNKEIDDYSKFKDFIKKQGLKYCGVATKEEISKIDVKKGRYSKCKK